MALLLSPNHRELKTSRIQQMMELGSDMDPAVIYHPSGQQKSWHLHDAVLHCARLRGTMDIQDPTQGVVAMLFIMNFCVKFCVPYL